MCLQVRKGIGVPVPAPLPSVRYLGINNCWRSTSWDLSARASAAHLLRARLLTIVKLFKKWSCLSTNYRADFPSIAQKCTLCFCGGFLQKISKYPDNHPISKITRDLSCPLDSSVYWRTSVRMARPASQSKLGGKLDLWSWFFNPLLFQLVTASFHFSQSTFRTAFEAGGSNVKNDAESTGSIHRREVQRRSILRHKRPDPSDGGQAGGHKRQHGLLKEQAHIWSGILFLSVRSKDS